jgi:YbgC/YbaW family acyl-CoA thioester hydrolase
MSSAAKTYRCELEVRGYELDSFGHVNHAVYLSYLEHARWKLLEQEGITLKSFQDWKRWPVIAGVEVQYVRPTFMGDRLDIRTQIIEHGRTNFVAEQTIFRGEILVLKAKIRIVTVNENGRPAEMPADIAKIWT